MYKCALDQRTKSEKLSGEQQDTRDIFPSSTQWLPMSHTGQWENISFYFFCTEERSNTKGYVTPHTKHFIRIQWKMYCKVSLCYQPGKWLCPNWDLLTGKLHFLPINGILKVQAPCKRYMVACISWSTLFLPRFT